MVINLSSWYYHSGIFFPTKTYSTLNEVTFQRIQSNNTIIKSQLQFIKNKKIKKIYIKLIKWSQQVHNRHENIIINFGTKSQAMCWKTSSTNLKNFLFFIFFTSLSSEDFEYICRPNIKCQTSRCVNGLWLMKTYSEPTCITI